MRREYVIALLVVIVGIFTATIYLLLRRGDAAAVTLDLAASSPAASPNVGPLSLEPGTLLCVHTPRYRAEITESGAVTLAPEAAEPRTFLLDHATFERLREDLGRLQAAWTARRVGEAAAGTTTTEPAPQVTVELRHAGQVKTLIALSDTSPEMPDLHTALAPLRMQAP